MSFRSYYIIFIAGLLTIFVVQITTIYRTHVFLSNEDKLFPKASLWDIFSSSVQDDDIVVLSKTFPNRSKTFFDISPNFAIHVIGERHSGVDWVKNELERCFGHAIHVTTGLLRSKYWWQTPVHSKTSDSLTEGDYGILVALFRNPYDWVEAMRLQPDHAVDHWNIIQKKPLEWQTFVTKPWTFDRMRFSEWMKEDAQHLKRIQKQYNTSMALMRQHLANQSCTEDFYWLDVIPCSQKDRYSTKKLATFPSDMLYELQRDGSGNPYDSILQLRRDKILHYHKDVASMSILEQYIPHRLEELIVRGTQHLLDSIENALPGIKAQCHATQPQRYVHKILPHDMIDYINANTDWKAEELVGYKKLSEKDWWEERQEQDRLHRGKDEKDNLQQEEKKDKSMYGIHILGERHTGTLWLQSHLEKCFGDQIKVHQGLSRYKYWFQEDTPLKDYGMVIATFRNVYDWILAMMDTPLHAPIHFNATSHSPLSVPDFLEKKWCMNKLAWETLLKDDLNTFLYDRSPETHVCYDNFTFLDVSPCSYKDRLRTSSIVQLSGDEIDNGDSSAVYEMRREHPLTGLTPYDNILQLRRDKMIHFASEIPQFTSVEHYIPVKFEDMVNLGTESLLKDIETRMGISSTCTATKLHDPKSSRLSFDRYSEDFVRRINKGVDWEAETLAGYTKLTRDKSQYGIHIIGERHTGTSWLQNHLEQCFGNQIKVYNRLSRHKYWFQFDDESKDYGLVVATSRNVYDWIYAMMKRPLHAPIHFNSALNVPMSFEDFIKTEWAPDRDRWNQLDILQEDQKMLNAYAQPESPEIPLQMKQCYDNFTFFDVIPCSFNDRMRTSNLITVWGDDIDDGDSSAVYEMKKDHPLAEFKPYKNILELRRDKMINFHSNVPKFSCVQHYVSVQFEEMVMEGTASLIQAIEKKMGLASQCTPEKLLVRESGTDLRSFKQKYIPQLNRDVDWSSESLAGYDKYERDKSEYGIHIVGERHTGTSWLQLHLDQCFGDQVKIYDRLSRHKYWFQFDDELKDYGLVIATFRNAYDWVNAMRREPLHAPIHYDISLNQPMIVTDFLSTPWIPPRDKWDRLQIFQDDKEKLYIYQHANEFLNVTRGNPLSSEPCYDSFSFFDVIPCSYKDRERSASLVHLGRSSHDGDSGAVYEMKKNHKEDFEPYDNILSLRRDKMIHFFQEVQTFSSIKHYISVKFEDLVDKGTMSLIHDIEKKMNIISRCKPENMTSNKIKIYSKEYIKLMNDGIDWSVEKLLGYEQLTLNSSVENVVIEDEKYIQNMSVLTPVDEKTVSPPKDEPLLDAPSDLEILYNITSNWSSIILKSIHPQWHPRDREHRFPSVDERVKVYMSNWYNPCQNSSYLEKRVSYYDVDSDINGSFPMMTTNPEIGNPFHFDSVITLDRPILFDRITMEACATNDTTLPLFQQRVRKFSLSHHFYCKDILDLANLLLSLDIPDSTSSVDTNMMSRVPIIVQIGDSLAHSRTVPIFSKFRMSVASEDSLARVITKDSSCDSPYLDVVHRPVTNWDSYYWDAKPVYQPIIWNLNRARHFGTELGLSMRKDIPWENKLDGAMWIGDMTGGPDLTQITPEMSSLDICLLNARCRFVYQHRNSSLVQAYLTGSKYPHLRFEDIDGGKKMLRRDLLSMTELIQYKVVISLEGNDVSSGLKWNLLSNSVVMMPPPTATSWLMEELLEPWVHYIPLKYDGSDAEDMIRWVIENDLKARRIAERGTLYMYDLLYHPDAKRDDELVRKEMLRRYRDFWN